MLEKLRYIQENLKAPKGQYNDFGKYSYRSCEDIFEAVKPLLKEKELVLQLTDELVQIGERYYVKATAKLYDENGQVENTAYAREEETKKGMDGSQITGASSSYARKYALNGLFLIDDVKDSDATNQGEDKEPKKVTKGTSKEEAKATPKQIEILNKFYKGDSLNKLLSTNKIEKLEDMPLVKANEIIKGIDKAISEKKGKEQNGNN